jgi:hypothetical protein
LRLAQQRVQAGPQHVAAIPIRNAD